MFMMRWPVEMTEESPMGDFIQQISAARIAFEGSLRFSVTKQYGDDGNPQVFVDTGPDGDENDLLRFLMGQYSPYPDFWQAVSTLGLTFPVRQQGGSW